MKAIAAVDKNFGIGADNDLLFNIPEDKKFFRRNTLNKVVIMGRKTFLSLSESKPLKDRINIVLTRNSDFTADGVTVMHDINELLEHLKKYDTDDVYIIGGGEIYSALLPYCNTALITKINAEKSAQVFFPDIDNITEWILSEQTEDFEYNGLTYKFCTYIKNNKKGNN